MNTYRLKKLYIHSLPSCKFITLLIALYINSMTAIADNIPSLSYQLLDTVPHNPDSFTQGWIKDGETFYESSGLYQRSFIQRYDNKQVKTRYLPKQYFAEGLTLFNNALYLLTWKEETLFIVDKDTLAITQTLKYQGEGWGLTHDQQHLIMSNGSSTLFFRAPDTLTILKTIEIKGLSAINELEYVDGIIWANSLNNDHIFAIHAHSGCIVGKVNLSPLKQNAGASSSRQVLNGIAYDTIKGGLWITGKLWPQRYLISLPEIPNQASFESSPC